MRKIDFSTAMLLSLFVHITCAYLLFFYIKRPAPDVVAKTVSIEILNLPPPKVARPRAAAPPRLVNHTEKNQIIEQDEKKTVDQTPPPKTRFLSSKNQSVKKQTQAKAKGHFKNSADAEKGPGAKKQISAKGNEDSFNDDLIQGIDEGMETLMNTKEFKYYAYYTKIKKQISRHWEGNVHHKIDQLLLKGRSIASVRKPTKLLITLDSQGTLMKVQVVSDSGIRDLDDAAVEAFKVAQPFPPPPKGIIDEDGTVKIRWDFILET